MIYKSVLAGVGALVVLVCVHLLATRQRSASNSPHEILLKDEAVKILVSTAVTEQLQDVVYEWDRSIDLQQMLANNFVYTALYSGGGESTALHSFRLYSIDGSASIIVESESLRVLEHSGLHEALQRFHQLGKLEDQAAVFQRSGGDLDGRGGDMNSRDLGPVLSELLAVLDKQYGVSPETTHPLSFLHIYDATGERGSFATYADEEVMELVEMIASAFPNASVVSIPVDPLSNNDVESVRRLSTASVHRCTEGVTNHVCIAEVSSMRALELIDASPMLFEVMFTLSSRISEGLLEHANAKDDDRALPLWMKLAKVSALFAHTMKLNPGDNAGAFDVIPPRVRSSEFFLFKAPTVLEKLVRHHFNDTAYHREIRGCARHYDLHYNATAIDDDSYSRPLATLTPAFVARLNLDGSVGYDRSFDKYRVCSRVDLGTVKPADQLSKADMVITLTDPSYVPFLLLAELGMNEIGLKNLLKGMMDLVYWNDCVPWNLCWKAGRLVWCDRHAPTSDVDKDGKPLATIWNYRRMNCFHMALVKGLHCAGEKVFYQKEGELVACSDHSDWIASLFEEYSHERNVSR